MRDNGSWHDEMLAEAFQDPEFAAEYDAFKLKFEIADQLKKIRKARHMSQAEVAASMGTTEAAISRLESAQDNTIPKLTTVERYARALNCNIEFRITPKKAKSQKNLARETQRMKHIGNN
jgi:transcriptional regulator with XRE-family HTH domain